MSQVILYKDEAYQLYCTIRRRPFYDAALTVDELREILQSQGGGREAIEERLERAHNTGCSMYGTTLAECISDNCAGPDGNRVSYEEFVQRWLTLPKDKLSQEIQPNKTPSHEFIARTNSDYAAWCKTQYTPLALDERGMASLHGLWAWQEQEKRILANKAMIRDIIANDAYAMTFQTLRQYRSALLKALD